MTKIAYTLALLSAMLVSSYSAPAYARARVFVASYGNDANPCTFGSPCKTFQQAVNLVDAGGEVTAIDSAGFGPINIYKAVSITSPNGVEAGIATPSGAVGIVINAGASDAISLQGLTIDGTGGAVAGVSFLFGGSLTIRNSVMRNFSASGIALAPQVASTIEISDTLVVNNGGHGIFLQPTSDSGVNVSAVFNRVEAYKNAQVGIGVFGNLNNGVTNATAIDCVAAHNLVGYQSSGSSPSFTHFRISKSTAYNNTFEGVFAENGGVIFVSQSDLQGNNTAPWLTSNGGGIFSYGDNLTSGQPLPEGGIGPVSKF
jgi:hypothetical protein